MADFLNIKSNGKIAMKFDEDNETLVDVRTCTEEDDVFIATKLGKCIRFPLADLRVFFSRNSTGVRGMRLLGEDRVISLSILKHIEATPEERDAYKVECSRRNREELEVGEDLNMSATITPERFEEMAASEEFLITVTDKGFGKRSSAYEYRIAGRGGQGIACMEMSARNGNMIAAFPVKETDEVMLVTNAGQLIRAPLANVRIAGRKTQGVTLFKVAGGERVVSVERIAEDDAGEVEGSGDGVE
jgi:DNA gyrase subunit A